MIDVKKAERLYKNSIKVLKSVQLKNGGCMATPLGERYPYVYPRDHSIIVLGFLSAGLMKEVKKGLQFVFNTQLKSGAFPQRYDRYGKDASYKPVQIDGTGLILYVTSQYIKTTKDFDFLRKNWVKMDNAADYIQENMHDEKELVYTPNSIHEFPPTEAGLEIWANATCAAALRELADAVGLMEKPESLLEEDRENWLNIHSKIVQGITRHLWNSRIKGFVKNIRLKESSSVVIDADASAIGLAEFGIFPDSDPKIKKTVKRIEKELWNKNLGGLCRYPKYEGRNNGGWGSWPHFTLMMCRHFIRLKDKKNADKYFKWVLDISYKEQLPEHVSTIKEFEEYVTDFTEAGLLRKDRLVMIENARKHPMFKKGVAYITLPLAWPHAEFIITWNLYKEIFLKKSK